MYCGKTILGLSFILALTASAQTRPLYLAHRGAHYNPAYNKQSLCPANSLCAFDTALDVGFDGFEFDLRLTKDKKFVISHGDNLQEGTNCRGQIKNKTYEDLKQNCRMDRSDFRHRSKNTDEISNLKDVINRYLDNPRAKKIYVDLKPCIGPDAVTALRESFAGVDMAQIASKFIFEIDDLPTQAILKAAFPTLPMFVTAEPGNQKSLESASCNQAIDGLRFPGVEALTRNTQAIQAFMARTRASGKMALGWNVRTQAQLNFINKNFNMDM